MRSHILALPSSGARTCMWGGSVGAVAYMQVLCWPCDRVLGMCLGVCVLGTGTSHTDTCMVQSIVCTYKVEQRVSALHVGTFSVGRLPASATRGPSPNFNCP